MQQILGSFPTYLLLSVESTLTVPNGITFTLIISRHSLEYYLAFERSLFIARFGT